MRLLSFLTEIEKALQAESPAVDGGAWEAARMINFHQGMARLTLSPRLGNDFPGGAIFLQSFLLADGSQCLKANLQWQGATGSPVCAVYSTPKTHWKLEASQIASKWLEGPTAVVENTSGYAASDLQPLVAAMG